VTVDHGWRAECDPAPVQAGWPDGFKSDVARFFGLPADASITYVEDEVLVYDPDEPCDTCKFSWFVVEVHFVLPDGRSVVESHRGDMGEFLRAVTTYADD
jgi:hypothetical protein